MLADHMDGIWGYRWLILAGCGVVFVVGVWTAVRWERAERRAAAEEIRWRRHLLGQNDGPYPIGKRPRPSTPNPGVPERVKRDWR